MNEPKLTTERGVLALLASMSPECPEGDFEAALEIDVAENERLDELTRAEQEAAERRAERLRLDVAERRLRVNDRIRRLKRREGGAST